jgi:hypothetical protein
MDIAFVNHVLPKITAMGTISFQAIVDSEYLWCEISVEALRDHFKALSMEKNDLLHAFHTGRATIENMARQRLEENDGRPILLMTVDF